MNGQKNPKVISTYSSFKEILDISFIKTYLRAYSKRTGYTFLQVTTYKMLKQIHL